jgi:hypothetical protein
MRREAPDREGSVPVSPLQQGRRDPEGFGKFRVEPVELLAYPFAEGMEAGSRRLFRPVRLGLWVLTPDRLGPERLASTSLPLRGGLGFDPLDEALDLAAVLFGRIGWHFFWAPTRAPKTPPQ